jgi:hypothetical protein
MASRTRQLDQILPDFKDFFRNVEVRVLYYMGRDVYGIRERKNKRTVFLSSSNIKDVSSRPG